MLTAAKRRLYEFIRCTRHNLLHLRRFHISYRSGVWHARDGSVEMRFPYYPYLAVFDIEGYLCDGALLPQPGMTVLDIGGCRGEYALYASKLVGATGRVLMFEPDPANIALARANFAINGNPSNIEVIAAGVWRETGRLQFNAGMDAQSALATADEPLTDNAVEIDVYSLADIVTKFNLDRLDLIKMDIEGAELDVISAAQALAPACKPSYAIASYHIVNGKQTAEALPSMFSAMGYQSRVGYPKHLTTWAFPATAGSFSS